MKKSLFKPKKIVLPDNLILIPHFWVKEYYAELEKRALKKFNILQSQVLVFGEYSLITGFTGYGSLLTMLEFIDQIDKKEVFFLGTAGSLNNTLASPESLNVVRIYADSIFKLFSKKACLDLKSWESPQFKEVTGVSIDIIQRETPRWLKKISGRKIDVVDMELFPLRVYLKKSFYALVVISDMVLFEGIKRFTNYKLFRNKFIDSYEFIERFIDERNESHID